MTVQADIANNSSMEVNKLLNLALGIADKVKTITTALQKQGLPPPSLDENAPSPDFLPPSELELYNLRHQVVGEARLLSDTLTGPRRYLTEYCLEGVSIALHCSQDSTADRNTHRTTKR